MKKKKVKSNGSQKVKQENPKVLGQVVIDVFNNGSVSVRGPIDNPLLVMDIFGKALTTVANFMAKQQQQANSKRIITPVPKDIIVPH